MNNNFIQTLYSKINSDRLRSVEKSPYLNHPQRLSDVITAIQILGTYKHASREIKKWHEYIGRDPLSAKGWKVVFGEHPEFFRIKNDEASLVWRRSRTKTYDTRNGSEITSEEYLKMSNAEKKNFSRRPLDPEQIQALMNSAIQMHSAAISLQKDKRWWVAIVASLAGVIIGALLRSCG